MIKELFDKKRQYVNHFFESVDLGEAEKFLQILLDCQGSIVLTGIGKSGLVAEKIAVTMTSTGTRALYMSPFNALHGDLGILSANDIFILISKSGETDELLTLIPYLRNKGVRLLSIVSNPKSRLAKACDFSITLPLEKELCPFDLAPTTSTVIQMIFGDILTIALMRHNQFSLDQYALNHPSGRIGKRITMKVEDLMLTGRNLPLCHPQDKLVDILVELSDKRCGCVLIVNEESKLQGIFTDGDLRRALSHKGPDVLQMPMEQLMTFAGKTVAAEKLAWEAMQLMEADPQHPITCLPVIEENRKLLGLIKMHDIIQSGL